VTRAITHLVPATEQRHEGIDPIAAERAMEDLLVALGIDISAESVRDTPRRVARMYGELLTPQPFDPTTFPNDGGYDELVVATGIPFHSLCEHHLLPFTGVAHVGYLPGDRIIGLSKLPRLIEYRSRRLQVQERLTVEVADFLMERLEPKGVACVVEATHLCTMMRGVKKQQATMVTSSMAGTFRRDARTRAEFMGLIGKAGAS
jgi:GTP cyclohydrolase IA